MTPLPKCHNPVNNPVHAPKPKTPRKSPENLKTEQDYSPAPRLPPQLKMFPILAQNYQKVDIFPAVRHFA